MLSAEQQQAWGSIADFRASTSSDWRLYGGAYEIRPPIVDAALVATATKNRGSPTIDPVLSALVTVTPPPSHYNARRPRLPLVQVPPVAFRRDATF